MINSDESTRRSSIVLVVTLSAIGAAGGYLSAFRTPPDYMATMRVLIAGAAQIGPSADSHADAIVGLSTCERVVATKNLSDCEFMREPARGAAALHSRLAATAVDDAGGILEIRFISPHRGDPPRVLAALVEAYREMLGDYLLEEAEQSLREIRFAVEALERERQMLTAERDVRTLQPPIEWKGSEDAARQRALLSDLETKMRSLQQHLARTEPVRSDSTSGADTNSQTASDGTRSSSSEASVTDDLAALREEETALLRKFGVNHPLVKEVRARLSTAQANGGRETVETRLLAEEQRLTAEYGPAHPRVRDVQARLAELRAASLDSPLISVSAPAVTVTNAAGPVPTDAGEARLYWTKQIELLAPQLERQRALARILDQYQRQDAELQDRIDRQRRLVDAAADRLKYLQKRQGTPPQRLIVLSPPAEARLVSRNGFRSAAVGAAIGGCLAATLVVVRRVGRRVATVEPPRPMLLTIPPGRYVLDEEGISDGISTRLSIVREPGGLVAESFRRARVALEFAAQREHVVRWWFVAAEFGRSEVEVLSNLAACFALAQRRVLLIDATTGQVILHAWGRCRDVSQDRTESHGDRPGATAGFEHLQVAPLDLLRQSSRRSNSVDVAGFLPDYVFVAAAPSELLRCREAKPDAVVELLPLHAAEISESLPQETGNLPLLGTVRFGG